MTGEEQVRFPKRGRRGAEVCGALGELSGRAEQPACCSHSHGVRALELSKQLSAGSQYPGDCCSTGAELKPSELCATFDHRCLLCLKSSIQLSRSLKSAQPLPNTDFNMFPMS